MLVMAALCSRCEHYIFVLWLPAACAKRKAPVYVSHSEVTLLDIEVSRPTGATRCTDGGEIWHGGGGPLLHAKFHPHPCNGKGIGPQN